MEGKIFFKSEGMVIYNHSRESNAEEEDENWKMNTALIMDITDDHCKRFFSRVMIAKARLECIES